MNNTNNTNTLSQIDVAPQIGAVTLGPNGAFAYTPPPAGPEFVDRFAFAFEFADGTKAIAAVQVNVRQQWEPKPGQAGRAPEILGQRV